MVLNSRRSAAVLPTGAAQLQGGAIAMQHRALHLTHEHGVVAMGHLTHQLAFHGTKGIVTLAATWVDDHFADDGNTANFAVPSYAVWDLTAEYQVHENLRLLAGVNNLFDADYFTRVRGDGIDPSMGRNVYVGASLEF
jgi:outer membrane receptor for ferrienterochelin and colicin